MDERNDYNSIPMQHIQTAVEWLVEQLARKNNEFQALTFYYDHKEEIQQAKEMEKEQIINAANQKIFGDITFTGSDEVITKGENYYNQTYNNENSNGTSIS